MSVTVIENFITPKECEEITRSLDSMCSPHPHLFGYLSTPGFESSSKAAALSIDNPIIDLNGSEDHDRASILLTASILKLKDKMEQHFNQKMSVINCNYVQMTAGASNGLHSDSTDLDGNPYHDAEELEFSGLLYFNDYGVGFTGGTITFPNEELTIKPKAGMAIFFKGDANHPHAVKTVISGSRKNAVIFFSKHNNTSDRSLFSDEHSGIPAS
jgi:hypothetical protein